MADQTLRDALADPGHVTAAVLGVGVEDVLTSLSYVDRRTAWSVPEVSTLAGFLRRQVDGLRLAREQGDATLVTQQLAYEAATAGARGLGREFARQLGDGGILTMWATRDTAVSYAGCPGVGSSGVGHAGQVTEVAVTGDATKAITAAKDGTSRIWRLASGRLLHAMPVVVLAPSGTADPPGRALSATPHRTAVPDPQVRVPLAAASGPWLGRIAVFAADHTGTTGVSGDLDGQAAIWDLVTGEPILRWPCGSAVTAVAIASDIGVAATATVHGEVALWDLVTGEPRARLSGHPAVRALALNPAADRLLVGGDTLAVYALAADDTPRLLARLHTAQPVTAVAVNPAMPLYAVFGGALGQVGYVRLPVDR